MKRRVGVAQIVLVMLIGRVIVIFTAAVSGGYTVSEMLAVLAGLPLILLLGIPILLLGRKLGGTPGFWKAPTKWESRLPKPFA